jgi:hypothetical protein
MVEETGRRRRPTSARTDLEGTRGPKGRVRRRWQRRPDGGGDRQWRRQI